MAKALIVSGAVDFDTPGFVNLSYAVQVDQGLRFGSTIKLDLTLAAAVIMLAIRNKVIADVQAKGGPVLGNADILVMGAIV